MPQRRGAIRCRAFEHRLRYRFARRDRRACATTTIRMRRCSHRWTDAAMIALLAALMTLIPVHGVAIADASRRNGDRSHRRRSADAALDDRALSHRTGAAFRARNRVRRPSRPLDEAGLLARRDAGSRLFAGASRPRKGRAGRFRKRACPRRIWSIKTVASSNLDSRVSRQNAAAFVCVHAMPRSHALSGDQRQVRIPAEPARSAPLRTGRDHARSAVRFTGRLAAYGARVRRARRRRWSLLTGTGSTIQRLLDAFRISSMRL